MPKKYIFDLGTFIQDVHRVAAEHGWWEAPFKTPLECMMLMCSEIAEAAEEVRLNPPRPPIYQLQGWGEDLPADIVTPDDPRWTDTLKTEGQAVELADCILRIFDYAEFHKLPLIEALVLKHQYNQTRPWKHGKKL